MMKKTLAPSGALVRNPLQPPNDSLMLFCRCGHAAPFAAPALDFIEVMRAARDEGWSAFGDPRGEEPQHFTVVTMVSAITGAIRASINARCPQCH